MQVNLPQDLVLPLAGGLFALILLILMLRFALRPKKARPPGPVLNLPGDPGMSRPNQRGREAAVAATAGPGVLAAHEPSLGEEEAVPSVATTRMRAGEDLGEDLKISEKLHTDGQEGGRQAAGAERVRAGATERDRACPKCGGAFAEGEMEGPLLMVDGIARDEFQPLLTARECRGCGYLELYTRPGRP